MVNTKISSYTCRGFRTNHITILGEVKNKEACHNVKPVKCLLAYAETVLLQKDAQDPRLHCVYMVELPNRPLYYVNRLTVDGFP
jgi:hypothetical protein